MQVDEHWADGLPLGPDWEYKRQRVGPNWEFGKRRVAESGAPRYGYQPPGRVSRFWPWPAGLVAFIGLTAIPDQPSPFVYFLAGAALVGFRNELRMQTVRENHRSLLRALVKQEEEQQGISGSK
ncbi:MAG: hypothetical protein M3067_06970 [Chloroflexota bacterium]|nr:hypothetical protein [Chloroflexota bacterium]